MRGFATLPDSIILDGRLTAKDVRVALALARYWNQGEGAAWPATKTLARDLNCAPSNITRPLKKLIDLGHLKRVVTRAGVPGFVFCTPIENATIAVKDAKTACRDAQTAPEGPCENRIAKNIYKPVNSPPSPPGDGPPCSIPMKSLMSA